MKSSQAKQAFDRAKQLIDSALGDPDLNPSQALLVLTDGLVAVVGMARTDPGGVRLETVVGAEDAIKALRGLAGRQEADSEAARKRLESRGW
jgi:hypothetical protein